MCLCPYRVIYFRITLHIVYFHKYRSSEYTSNV
nr:MAG TPA: hypothetical protein [Caudoviricetes sp.]